VNRTAMRVALAAAVKNKTSAGSKVFHERRVAFGVEELPAINIVFAESETPAPDEAWNYTNFTVAGIIKQADYNAEDGGLSFAADVDTMLDELKAALSCIRLNGCVAVQVERASMSFSAEGRGMMGSAWVTVQFTTEGDAFNNY
jgi:hypothetical protein